MRPVTSAERLLVSAYRDARSELWASMKGCRCGRARHRCTPKWLRCVARGEYLERATDRLAAKHPEAHALFTKRYGARGICTP